MNSHRLCLAFWILSAFLMASCLSDPPAPPLPQAPVSDEQILSRLTARDLDEFGGALGDGVIPPNMSSFRFEPSAALGAMFAAVANPGTTCEEVDPLEDLELIRVMALSMTDDNCHIINRKDAKLVYEEGIIKGGVDIEFDYLVGDAELAGEHVFEFSVTGPESAVYPGSESCVDTKAIMQYRPPTRVCGLYMIVGARLVEVIFRQYSKIEGSVQYNSIVNVNGDFYGSTERLQSQLLLLVDPIDLSGWLTRDEDGFLAAWPDSQRLLVSQLSLVPTNEQLIRNNRLSENELSQWNQITSQDLESELEAATFNDN